MKMLDTDQILSSKTIDRHRDPTASVPGTPEQSQAVLNTVSLNKVQLTNSVSSLRLIMTHSTMKMFAELNNLYPRAELYSMPTGCVTF